MQCVCTPYTQLPECIIELIFKKSAENQLENYWHFIYQILTLKFNKEQIYV